MDNTKEKDKKINIRKKSEEFIKIDKNETTKKEIEIKNEKNEIPKNKKNKIDEDMKMYFYYPKYLQPEAVALIAQNLLNEWEEEN
jgi:hypothetical protein